MSIARRFPCSVGVPGHGFLTRVSTRLSRFLHLSQLLRFYAILSRSLALDRISQALPISWSVDEARPRSDGPAGLSRIVLEMTKMNKVRHWLRSLSRNAASGSRSIR